MHFSDNSARLEGYFHVEIRRNGVLIGEFDELNLIVAGAKNQLARMIGGDAANRNIVNIGFGIGASPAAPGNTALTSAYTKAVTSIDYPAAGQVRFNWSLSTSEANGKEITEFGLICADGTLFSRKVRAPIQKESDLSLSGSWTIIF